MHACTYTWVFVCINNPHGINCSIGFEFDIVCCIFMQLFINLLIYNYYFFQFLFGLHKFNKHKKSSFTLQATLFLLFVFVKTLLPGIPLNYSVLFKFIKEGDSANRSGHCSIQINDFNVAFGL